MLTLRNCTVWRPRRSLITASHCPFPLRAGSCWLLASNPPPARSTRPLQPTRPMPIRSISSGERRRFSRQSGNCCPGPEGCYRVGCCPVDCYREDGSCVVRTARFQHSIGTGWSVLLRKDCSIGVCCSAGGLGPLHLSLSLNWGMGFWFGVRGLMRYFSHSDWC